MKIFEKLNFPEEISDKFGDTDCEDPMCTHNEPCRGCKQVIDRMAGAQIYRNWLREQSAFSPSVNEPVKPINIPTREELIEILENTGTWKRHDDVTNFTYFPAHSHYEQIADAILSKFGNTEDETEVVNFETAIKKLVG